MLFKLFLKWIDKFPPCKADRTKLTQIIKHYKVAFLSISTQKSEVLGNKTFQNI